MSTIDLEAAPTIVGGGSSAPPPAPSIIEIVQEGPAVAIVALAPTTTGSSPLAALRLYGGPSSTGPWTQIDQRNLSEISVRNHLYDEDPAFGIATHYQVTCLDSLSVESAPCAPQTISPIFT